jgi:cyanophycin synthetase
LPFVDSRRLTGSNLFFASTGAVLDVVGVALDDALLAAWRSRIERAGAQLGWISPQTVSRPHAGGVLLAISAPRDQLLLATEVNEWALCATLVDRDRGRWQGLGDALIAAALDAADDGTNPLAQDAPVIEESAAFARFQRLASLEIIPGLAPLLQATGAAALPHFIDDTELTLGAGAGSRSYPLSQLPQVDEVPWQSLFDIPTAIVTGSNGKTTTVRLIAACVRAHA